MTTVTVDCSVLRGQGFPQPTKRNEKLKFKCSIRFFSGSFMSSEPYGFNMVNRSGSLTSNQNSRSNTPVPSMTASSAKKPIEANQSPSPLLSKTQSSASLPFNKIRTSGDESSCDLSSLFTNHELSCQWFTSDVFTHDSVNHPDSSSLTIHTQFTTLVHEPLINNILNDNQVLVIAVTQEDSNPKSSSSSLLGTCSISLLPFFHNEMVIDQWVSLIPSHLQMQQTPSPPQIQVRLAISNALLLREEKQKAHFLSITLNKMTQIPERWISNELSQSNLSPEEIVKNHLFQYTMQVPALVHPSGHFLYYPIQNGKLVFKNNSFFVEWDKSMSFYLTEESMKYLEKACSRGDELILKLSRTIIPEKQLDGYVDYNEDKYRASIRISMRALLSPGKTTFSFEKNVDPLSATELEDEKMLLSQHNSLFQVPPKSASKTKRTTLVSNKKFALPHDLSIEEEEDVHPYLSSMTKCHFELVMDPSIIPLPEHRLRCKLRIGDVLAPRMRSPKKVSANELFHKEIQSIVNIIAEQYKEYKKRKEDQYDDNIDSNKQQFIFELNRNGTYYIIKDMMKKTVLKVVEENFNNGSPPSAKLEQFYNEFYVFLTQKMHKSINELFEQSHSKREVVITQGNIDRDQVLVSGRSETKSQRMKRIANEYEIEFNNEIAAQYHKERIVWEKSQSEDEDWVDPQVWYEYGLFNMRVRNLEQAEQAFRDAVSTDMSHMNSLLVYGILLCMQGKHREAEVFVQSSIDIDPNRHESWGILALLFELNEQMKESNQAFLYGEQVFLQQMNRNAYNDHESSTTMLSNMLLTHRFHHFSLSVAHFLLQQSADTLAEHFLNKFESGCSELSLLHKAQESLDNIIDYHVLKALLYLMRGQLEESERQLKSGIEKQYKSHQCWRLLGEVHVRREDWTSAEESLETALSIASDHQLQNVYFWLRLGRVYLELEKNDQAQQAYMRACEQWPSSCISWLGLGISYLGLGDLESAEQALNEANIHNNRNGEVWAYLALLCFYQERNEEAKRALRQCQTLGSPLPTFVDTKIKGLL